MVSLSRGSNEPVGTSPIGTTFGNKTRLEIRCDITMLDRNSRAVFLDRDGTIIKDIGYLGNPDSVEMLPGAVRGLKRLVALDLRLVVVSNQSGVGRGLLTRPDVRNVNRRVAAILSASGVAIDGFYYCPHTPDDECNCRKPLTGLFTRARDDLSLNLKASFVVGDYGSDIEAGYAIGARPILIRGPRNNYGHGAASDLPTKSDLLDASRLIEMWLRAD